MGGYGTYSLHSGTFPDFFSTFYFSSSHREDCASGMRGWRADVGNYSDERRAMHENPLPTTTL